MNLFMKTKRLFLASIITLTLVLGTVAVTTLIEAGNSGKQVTPGYTTNGGCWKCNL